MSERGVAVLLSVQGVGYDVGLVRMVVDSEVIILNQLQLSLLPQIQIHLSKDVLEAFVIMPPYLKCMHHCC
jgi:hypothetical protein